MKSIKRVRKQQPDPRKKVVELEIGGWLGRWFTKNNWGAFTYPLPFLVLIFYWTAESAPDGDVNGLIRVHEFVHVAQDERNACFLVSWARYMWATYRAMPLGKLWRANGLRLGQVLMQGYRGNALEVEAYEVQRVAQDHGLPSWAK